MAWLRSARSTRVLSRAHEQERSDDCVTGRCVAAAIASLDQTDRSPGAPRASPHTRSRGADALLGGVLSVPNAGGVASFGALNECSVRGRTGVVGGLVGAAPICTRNVPRAAHPPRATVRLHRATSRPSIPAAISCGSPASGAPSTRRCMNTTHQRTPHTRRDSRERCT